MNLKIRPADLDADRDRIIEIVSRHLAPRSTGARFDWLYRGNPHGPARAWIAEDPENGEVVGLSSAFPRRIRAGSQTASCWVLGDFCVGGSYRALGPAIQLQRACLAEVDAGTVEFCYDFPSESMMAVYKRLSVAPHRRLIRYALPLSVDRKVAERLPAGALARAVGAISNRLLAMGTRLPESAPGRTIAVHEGDWGEEFGALAETAITPGRVALERTGRYLTWRYRENPVATHEILAARTSDEKLVAFAIFTQQGADAVLADLVAVNDETTLAALLGRLARLLRERGVATLSAPLLETHRWAPLLARLGFRAREEAPVILYGNGAVAKRFAAMPWDLVHGDRDS